MQIAPIPQDEDERIVAVHRMAILDTKPEERFDVLTKEAVQKLKVPMSMISIIDSNREWFKSCIGLDQKEGDRSVSFCGHALLTKSNFIIEDTLKDVRFADNPMVVGFPNIRSYMGQALLDYRTGKPVGVFCIKDTKPRKFTVSEIDIFMDLADKAEKELNKV